MEKNGAEEEEEEEEEGEEVADVWDTSRRDEY